ncbi:hypothetical protein PV04_09757 [Phialophora macrospora]|uniref:Rad21/Rec8-like protein N-terminal domain-containing protein n=1 Tax=Phialophora macrospora TaxID=1851006 RepID=A0A0D2F7C6_9EURO|nr:hypothetical protein PV04_09757 [Phialophora macrospora]
MFYSEQLLAKTGPLARVWLAANVERKLSKSQILQSDIESSVGAIVDRGHEPMALRLSGQLMLGVVRIYGRKARYLLDDCNEALLKIRMTFKSTNNHDLPANATAAVDLNLPELLTIDDLFASMEFTLNMTQPPAIADAKTQDPVEDWTSSLNPQLTSTQSMLYPGDEPLYNDDDLNLDFTGGYDMAMDDTTVSINVGRFSTPKPGNDTIFGEGLLHDDEDDLNLDLDQDIPMPDQPDVQMADDTLPFAGDGESLVSGDDETLQLRQAAEDAGLRRHTESPLSEADPNLLHELDRSFQNQLEEEGEEEIEAAAHQRQRIRKQKPIAPDVETVLHNRQIVAQAKDRSKILQAPSFLPRDPLLLTLMSMQKKGDFATHAIHDGRSKHWAPELQDLLAVETLRSSGELIRKRDSAIAGLSDYEYSDKSPRLRGPEYAVEDEAIQLDDARPLTPAADDLLPYSMGEAPLAFEDGGQSEDDESVHGGDDTFDDTTMPLIHPADSGPISLDTKHAVHLLRGRLGDAGGAHRSSPARKSVLLQNIVPEGRASKEDATKMFFEVLVLATKDAIKVDQGDTAIGLPLRIRAKRGLWGSWAEPSPGDDPTTNTASQQVAAAA